MQISKKITSLVIAIIYALGLLFAVPVQAYALTPGTKTHVVAKYYSKAQKAAQTKKALAALAKLPATRTASLAYDNMYEYDLLITRFDIAHSEVKKAKNMGINYKKLKNYARLNIAIARMNNLSDVVKKIGNLCNYISELTYPITLGDTLWIECLQRDYEELKSILTPKEMKLIYNSGELLKAIEYFDHLNTQPVYGVLYLIFYKFPDKLTLADEAVVKEARAAYTALSPENRSYVYAIDKLVKAEAYMELLKAPESSVEIIPGN